MKTEITFMVLITAIGLIGISYGEEYYEELISFPIPDNVSEVKHQCTITHIDATNFEMTCKYSYVAENVQEWYDEIIEKYGLVDPTFEPVIEEEIPSNFVPLKIPEDLKRYEEDIKRFVTNPPKTYTEETYSNQLAELDPCSRGDDEAFGIQKPGIFFTSEYEEESTLRAGHVTGNSGKLDKAIEECDVIINILKPITLGPETLHKGWMDSPQRHHSQMAHVDGADWQTIPNQEPFAIVEHDFLKQEKIAFDDLCFSELPKDLRMQQGCDDVRNFKADGTCPNGYGHIPNEENTFCVMPKYDGLEKTLNPFSDEITKTIKQFNRDGGYTMALDLQKEIIQEMRLK